MLQEILEVIVPILGEYDDTRPNPDNFTEHQKQWASLARCTHFMIFGKLGEMAIEDINNPDKVSPKRLAHRTPREIWNAIVWMLGYDETVDIADRIRCNPLGQRSTLWPIEQKRYPNPHSKSRLVEKWKKPQLAKYKKKCKKEFKASDRARDVLPVWEEIERGDGFDDGFWKFLEEKVDPGDQIVSRANF